MENEEKYKQIAIKLCNGMAFGLFEDGQKCYFQDGEKVSYTDLWKALRVLYREDEIHHKTLPEICPDLFAGTFAYKFSKHKWKKKEEVK